MEENVKSNNNNNPSQIKIPPGFGKISDGLDREKVDTFAYQEQSKVQISSNSFEISTERIFESFPQNWCIDIFWTYIILY